jgi:uncharacterized protein (TIGR01244 family)
MAVPYRWLSPSFATAGQIAPDDVASIAAEGFSLLVNNRPDFEAGPGQPTSEAIEEAAKAAGIAYVYLPVVPGRMTPDDAMRMAAALRTATGPVFAFCRTGARTEFLYRLAAQVG